MSLYKDCQYKFQEKDGVINLTDFLPRSSATLEAFVNEHQGKKIFYLQKSKEGFTLGKIYSYLLYSPSIKILLRPGSLPDGLVIEEGQAIQRMDDVKELAIRNNKDNVIFHPEMLAQFNTNTPMIEKAGFCFQVLDGKKVIGHASVVKVADATFGNSEVYAGLRFIVDEPYRSDKIKEVLLARVVERLPENAPLYIQVFPDNEVAIRFFLRRSNLVTYYEKWKIG